MKGGPNRSALLKGKFMSRRIRLCVSGFLFLVLVFSAFSQSTGGGNIPFDLDMARFKVREGWSLLEVYFAIPRDALEHNLREKQFVAMYEISVSLLKKDSVVAQDTWKSTDTVDSLEQVKKGHRIYNQTSFYLKDGDYRLRARVTDLTKMEGGWYEQDFSVLQYSDTLFEISDIELGIQIFPDTSKNA